MPILCELTVKHTAELGNAAAVRVYGGEDSDAHSLNIYNDLLCMDLQFLRRCSQPASVSRWKVSHQYALSGKRYTPIS